MRISRRLGVLAAVGTLLATQAVVQLITSGPAAAVPGWTFVDVRPAPNSDPVRVVRATCPSGTQLIGGGGQIIGDASTKVFLTELRPLNSQTYEAAGAEMYPGWDRNWSVAAFAICTTPLRGWELRTGNSGPGAADFKTTYTSACSDHKKAFSAGGRVNVAAGLEGQVGLTMVRPDGPLTIGRASARVAPAGFWDSWSVDSFVICAYPLPKQTNVSQIPGLSWASVGCPAGTVVVGAGGGAGTVDLHRGYLQGIVPFNRNAAAVYMTDKPDDGGAMAQATCVE
jgi:hypothetical protein